MRRFVKNSSFGVIQLFFSMLMVFFSIPIFIHTYGLNMYGVFSIISIFGNLTLLFNLGLNTTLLKFISANNLEGVRNAHISVSLVILGIITLFFSLLFLLFQNYIIGDFFKIDPVILPKVISSFRLFILANVFIMLGQPFVALIQANNDYYKTSTIQWIYNLINGFGIIIISKFEAPFSFIAVPALISAIVWFLILLYQVTVKYNFKPFLFSKDFIFIRIARQQMKYSLQVYLISLLSFFNEPLLKILVAKSLGPAAVGNFDIILKIKGQLIGLLTKVFEPLSTIIASEKEKSQIKIIVHYSAQAAVLTFIPLSLIIWFLSDAFLKIWLIEISSEMIYSIKLSVVIFTFSMVVLPNFYYLIYHNKMKDCIVIQVIGIITSLLSLFVSISFTDNSYIPPVISICFGIIGSFIVNIYYQWKNLRSVIFDKTNFLLIFFILSLSLLFFISNRSNLYVFELLIIVLSIYLAFVTVKRLIKQGVFNFLK